MKSKEINKRYIFKNIIKLIYAHICKLLHECIYLTHQTIIESNNGLIKAYCSCGKVFYIKVVKK